MFAGRVRRGRPSYLNSMNKKTSLHTIIVIHKDVLLAHPINYILVKYWLVFLLLNDYKEETLNRLSILANSKNLSTP
jgi:hypothetical protein